MHEPTLINPLEENWNKVLMSSAGSSFFHTSNWAGVLNKSYNYRPFYLCGNGTSSSLNLLPIMEVDSKLTGRRGVCLPFTDTCEPLAENAEQFHKLIDYARAIGKDRKWKYLEIRGEKKYLSPEKPSKLFYGHKLDLTCGLKQLFANLRDSTRRNIKKSQKENVNVMISTSPQSVDEYYRLNSITRKEHGLPPQPYKFFQHLGNEVFAKDMGVVALARLDDQVIAANVYLNFGREVIYKYGASDKKFSNLRANNLLIWEAIKWSCEKGFKTFCFGRTEPENEGLRQFKNGWGTRESIIKYYKYDFYDNAFISKSPSTGPFVQKIFKTLPVPFLNALGTILYRHAG